MWRGLLVTTIGLLWAAPCLAGQGQEEPPPPRRPAEPARRTVPDPLKPGETYRYRIGDLLGVLVSPHKGYDFDLEVEDDGYIRHPKLDGKIMAFGKTSEELERKLVEELNKNLKGPRVTVRTLRRTPLPEEKPPPPGKYTLVGAVGRAGEAELEPELRLRKAIDKAGGFDKDADKAKIIITRKNLTQIIVDLSTDEAIKNLAHNLLLQDGDSIEVKRIPPPPEEEKQIVYISGQVGTGGRVDFRKGMSLEELILASGKLTPLADWNRVQIIREGKITVVDLEKQSRLGPAGKVPVLPNDEVFIPEVKDRVLLIGGVPAPGPRQLRPDEKLFDFLLRHEAAVFDQSKVDYEHAEVIRSGQEKPIPVNLRDLLKRADRRNNEKDNVPLKNGDIVFIPPKRESRKDFFTYLASSAPFLFGFL